MPDIQALAQRSPLPQTQPHCDWVLAFCNLRDMLPVDNDGTGE